MTDSEFDRLADDIEANGLIEPITLLDGAILDGRHRQRACDERQIEPRYSQWDPDCGITPLEWVISKNLHRRQLTVSQRAVLAAELKDRLAEAAWKRKIEGGRLGGQNSRLSRESKVPIKTPEAYGADKSKGRKIENESAYIAAQQFGIGDTSVKRALRIKKDDPELFEQVRAGEITTSAASAKLGYADSHAPQRKTKVKLKDAIDPLRKYLKNWNEDRLYGMTPKEARKMLAIVQEVDQGLFEVERALEERTIVSRALQ